MNLVTVEEDIKALVKDVAAMRITSEQEFEAAKDNSQTCSAVRKELLKLCDALEKANKDICAMMDKYTRSMFGTGKKEPQKPPAAPKKPSLALDDFDSDIDPLDEMAAEIKKTTNGLLF